MGHRGGEFGADEQTDYLPDYRYRLHNALHLTASYPYLILLYSGRVTEALTTGAGSKHAVKTG
jgi:hypothetical protein